jgi:hypothetical protein
MLEGVSAQIVGCDLDGSVHPIAHVLYERISSPSNRVFQPYAKINFVSPSMHAQSQKSPLPGSGSVTSRVAADIKAREENQSKVLQTRNCLSWNQWASSSRAKGDRVIVRALGPSLAAQGIADPLEDPELELHDQNGALIASNENWKDTQEEEIEATGLAPNDELEAAIVLTIVDGSIHPIVRGANDTVGVGLVEIFDLH